MKTDAGRCSEMFFDTLINDFRRIVKYSKVIIDYIKANTLPNYNFEVGVLPPLHVTAMKCRDPKVRREAIALLRQCPVQEGVWEGHACAESCTWLMDLEESGIVDGLPENRSVGGKVDFIPEWNRVRLTQMVTWSHKSTILMQCTSVLPVVQGKHMVLERTFIW